MISIRYIKASLVLFFIFTNLFASNGILDKYDKNAEEFVKPIISSLSISHELPASHFMYNRKPALAFTGKMYIQYTDQLKKSIPVFWSGVNINQNLQISNSIVSSKIENQEAYNFGPTVTILFGNNTIDWALNIGTKFFKGPDNFDYNNISMSLSKQLYIFENYKTVVGITRHYNDVDVNYTGTVKSDSFSWSGDVMQHFIKFGFYKNKKNVYCGFEANISRNILGLSFVISGITP